MFSRNDEFMKEKVRLVAELSKSKMTISKIIWARKSETKNKNAILSDFCCQEIRYENKRIKIAPRMVFRRDIQINLPKNLIAMQDTVDNYIINFVDKNNGKKEILFYNEDAKFYDKRKSVISI